jgi:hypothetical protein
LTNKLAEIAALNASSGTNGSEDRVVENLNYIREKLRDRIRLEEDEVSAGPRTSLVEIVDRAEPPLRPRHDRRALAIATLFAGLGAIALGRRLLRKAQAIAAPIRGADVATVRGV